MRELKFVPGEYYHIYNRGNSKQLLFKDVEDYQRFQMILYVYNTSKKFKFRDLDKKVKTDLSVFQKPDELVDILAYVLMPNHFHLLVHAKENLSGKEISLFVKKVSMSYSLYFNEKYNRTGALFEGRFQATHLSGDKYFKYMFAYIHLNPVKLIQSNWKEKGIKNVKEAVAFLNNFKFSSYFDYKENSISRTESLIIKKDIAKEFFTRGFSKDILEWLSLK